MGFKQHISRTWQMIEQQVNDVPFRPDNEAFERLKQPEKPVFMRVSEIGKTPENTDLHQTYIKRCRDLCRGRKIA